MGAELSSQVSPDEPTRVLKRRDLASVADYIKDGEAKKIVVMLGAGVSTAAGIPDFRSPDTGLYSQLARLDLPHPEAVFELDFFRERPEPFYTLAQELYPGVFTPTYTHAFIALLSRKNLLHKCFTQNIDCLERLAGVPAEMMVEAHGSFATQRCIECKTPFPDREMREHVKHAEVPRCTEEGCGGLVKPDIVFFGEALPKTFFESRESLGEADLCLVLGTSLSVQPFASLPLLCNDDCPRVLVNMERVGGLGSRVDDVLCLGKCDDGIRELVELLGWEDEVDELWKGVGGRPLLRKVARPEDGVEKSKDERHNDEVDKLMEKVEKDLKISHAHQEALRDTLQGEEKNETKEAASTDQQMSAEERVKIISKAVAQTVEKSELDDQSGPHALDIKGKGTEKEQ